MLLLHPTMYYVMFPTHRLVCWPQRVPPVISTSWYLCPCIIPPLECGLDQVTCFKRIECGKSDASGVIKTLWCPSWVLCLALLLACSERSQCHVVICSMKAHTARNCGKPPGNRQWVTEAFSPTVHKELNSANNHISELGSGSSPRQAFRWGFNNSQHSDCNHMRDLESEAPR